MTNRGEDTDSAVVLRAGLARAEWTVVDLWRAALAVGGGFDCADVALITSGARSATPAEHDILAATMNDHFVGHGQNHPVRYWHQLKP